MRSCPALMFLCRSMLSPELRGRLFNGSFVSGSASDVSEAFDACKVLAREVVEALAERLSSNLWNLRFVVASAGWASVDAISAVWSSTVRKVDVYESRMLYYDQVADR